MRDDATTTLPRRSAPAGPRSAGLSVVPGPELAPVIRLSPRARRAAGWAPPSPTAGRLLVVLPDATPAVVLPGASGTGDEASLSIQDRVRLRALESVAPRP